MPSPPRCSPWRIPLVRELTLILLLKLAVLLGIRAVWFGAPTVPDNGTARVGQHLLGSAPQPSLPLNEESPR